jgi:hypothetical protein
MRRNEKVTLSWILGRQVVRWEIDGTGFESCAIVGLRISGVGMEMALVNKKLREDISIQIVSKYFNLYGEAGKNYTSLITN